MVHHGHKTEEREHALNNISPFKTIQKAQGINALCLSSMVFLFALFLMTPSIVFAQAYNMNPGANNEIRLQQLETQIRDLTGRLEEQDNEISQLKEKLLDLQNAQIKSQNSAGASQIEVPTRDPAPMPNPKAGLNTTLPFETPELSGIKTKPVTAGNELPMEATAQYESSFAALKAKNYDMAQEGFEDFLKNNKGHLLSANAKYWLGETHYVRGEYKEAAKTFAEGFQTYPESAKAPDMLLKLGMALNGMGKEDDACVALSQVAVKFPLAGNDLLARATAEMDRLGCKS